MFKPDLLILANDCSVISVCSICSLLVHPLNWLSAQHMKGSDRNSSENNFHDTEICPVQSGFQAYLLLDQHFTIKLIFFDPDGFENTHFEQSVILLHYTNRKTTPRQRRWQMRLSFLSGFAHGNNQGKWGSAGPTVISRRPRVHVSFNSSTRTSVD